MTVGIAVGMALFAAVLFAVAAVAQNTAVADVVRGGGPQTLGGAQFQSLARSRVWVGGVSLTAIASVVHAGALVLAPVAVVQPIGWCWRRSKVELREPDRTAADQRVGARNRAHSHDPPLPCFEPPRHDPPVPLKLIYVIVARHHAPVIKVKVPVSARFWSEDERITIADLRRRGHTIRDIGVLLGSGAVHGQPGAAS